MPNDARISYAGKTIANPAAPQDCIDAAVGIGDYGNPVVLPDAFQSVACFRENLVPVRRVLGVFDQRVPNAIVEGAQILKKIRVKSPPEAVVDLASHHAGVEFQLRTPLEGVPLGERRMPVNTKRS